MFLSENGNCLGAGGGGGLDIFLYVVDRIYLEVILLGSYCVAGWLSLRASIKYLRSYSPSLPSSNANSIPVVVT